MAGTESLSSCGPCFRSSHATDRPSTDTDRLMRRSLFPSTRVPLVTSLRGLREREIERRCGCAKSILKYQKWDWGATENGSFLTWAKSCLRWCKLAPQADRFGLLSDRAARSKNASDLFTRRVLCVSRVDCWIGSLSRQATDYMNGRRCDRQPPSGRHRVRGWLSTPRGTSCVALLNDTIRSCSN